MTKKQMDDAALLKIQRDSLVGSTIRGSMMFAYQSGERAQKEGAVLATVLIHDKFDMTGAMWYTVEVLESDCEDVQVGQLKILHATQVTDCQLVKP